MYIVLTYQPLWEDRRGAVLHCKKYTTSQLRCEKNNTCIKHRKNICVASKALSASQRNENKKSVEMISLKYDTVKNTKKTGIYKTIGAVPFPSSSDPRACNEKKPDTAEKINTTKLCKSCDYFLMKSSALSKIWMNMKQNKLENISNSVLDMH
jgi:hypothetical protein